MFRYNINSLKSEINSFNKLVEAFKKKSSGNKKARTELNIIEENLNSKIESMLIAESSEINPIKRNKNTNLILKQKIRLSKSIISYDNSLSNLKNLLSCRLALFNSTKKLLFCKRNKIISLLILLFILFPLLSLYIILILLKFLLRKKDKSKKKKKKVSFNDIKSTDIDDKLFDMADRYAKNKEDVKVMIDILKGKLSPVELEGTLKKLKKDPLFKDLVDEENLPKLFKELGDMLEKQISDFKNLNLELFAKLEKKLDGIKEEKTGLLSNIANTISSKLMNKVKKGKKAAMVMINGEMSKVRVKIKKFKNINKRLMANHVDHEFFDMFVPVHKKGPKSKKLKPKMIEFNDIINDYKIKNKKFKSKNKKFETVKYNKIKKYKNIKYKESGLENWLKEIGQYDEKTRKRVNKIGKKQDLSSFKGAIKSFDSKSKKAARSR